MTAILELCAVSVRFGRRWVLREVSLVAEAGEIVALIGDNGAGKSTALAVAAGVLEPDRGAVLVEGQPLRRQKRLLGYVPEAAQAPDHLTAGELVALAAALKGAALLERPLAHRLMPGAIASARVASLSLGERRRACLAAALVGSPRLLILDEPDNGLDVAGVELLVELLDEHRARGGAAMIASHDHALIDRLAARRLTLASGRCG